MRLHSGLREEGADVAEPVQEHVKKVWDAAARRGVVPPVPGEMPPPPV